MNNTKTALITGGGSGIGRCYAKNLAVMGYNIIIAGNIESDLFQTKEGIEYLCAVRVDCILIDLSEIGASEKLFALSKKIADVDILINNAGIFSFCDICNTPKQKIEQIVMLHDLTLTLNCKIFAADMIERGVKGHILNMSSFSIWMPFPGLSLYSASKAFVKSFSVAFAKEVRENGLKVTTVCPAGVATNLYGLPKDLQKLGCRLGVLITADSCAKRGLKAMFRGRKCIVPDWWNRLFIPFSMLLPDFVISKIRKVTTKYQK